MFFRVVLVIVIITAGVVGAAAIVRSLRLRTRTGYFRGKTVIITGASRGIGQALAVELAKRGANLALVARTPEMLDYTASLCKSYNPDVVTQVFSLDITLPENREEIVSAVLQKFQRIDLLVNNAGIVQGGTVEELSAYAFQRHIDVNLIAPIHLTQLVLPTMRSQRRGDVVLVSSVMGLHALPYMAPYSVSKFGLTGFGQALRRELHRSGVNVLTSFIGFADTRMVSEGNRSLLRTFGVRIQPVDKIARHIADGVALGRREVVIGTTEFLAVWIGRFSPALADWMWATFMPKTYKEEAAKQVVL